MKKSPHDQIRQACRIIPVEAGNLGGKRPVDSEGHQVVFGSAETLFPDFAPVNLDLRVRVGFVPLHEDDVRIPDIAFRDLGKFVIPVRILDDRNLNRRSQNRRHGACPSVAPAVLPLMIDFEAVAVVLDRRYPPAQPRQLDDQLLDQSGLSGIGFPDNGNNGDHYLMIPMPARTDSMTAAAMTEPIWPPALAPIACISR